MRAIGSAAAFARIRAAIAADPETSSAAHNSDNQAGGEMVENRRSDDGGAVPVKYSE
jgi:hypothetical protein